MSTIRKLSQFRQLSLNCETPPSSNRRKTLKKQYSQDFQDDSWASRSPQIKVSVNSKVRKNFDAPPPLRIAWSEKSEAAEDAVIVKKCKEVRRPPTAKLVRHSSLEKDSILHSKHELAERLKQNLKDKEEKEEVTQKTNLKIFLSHRTKEDDISQIDCTEHHSLEPKLMQPLTVNEKFQIRKSKPKLEVPSPRDKTLKRSNTVVVVPIIIENNKEESSNEELKAINNIIIRPVTATSRREQFQKRTNSAFHSTVRDSQPIRPPLIRSSSAPSTKEKGKFLATKRKLKAKRCHIKNVNIEDEDSENSNKENPKSQKELNRTTAVIGAEVVTMVSLVSPSGSENEDEPSEDEKEKEKINNLKNIPEKNIAKPKEEKETLPKHLSLRKTVKSVSFQQSSIHAIRSFSASFPGRRASMAAVMLPGGGGPANGNDARAQGTKSAHARKAGPDDGERVPKRRLVRSSTVDCGGRAAAERCDPLPRQNSQDVPGNITIDIKSKPTPELRQAEIPPNAPKISPEKTENPLEKVPEDGRLKYETPKEKQCWELYCKMSGKGINVSYDTILRGMLTPTEYRMRRKNSALENPLEVGENPADNDNTCS